MCAEPAPHHTALSSSSSSSNLISADAKYRASQQVNANRKRMYCKRVNSKQGGGEEALAEGSRSGRRQQQQAARRPPDHTPPAVLRNAPPRPGAPRDLGLALTVCASRTYVSLVYSSFFFGRLRLFFDGKPSKCIPSRRVGVSPPCVVAFIKLDGVEVRRVGRVRKLRLPRSRQGFGFQHLEIEIIPPGVQPHRMVLASNARLMIRVQ